MQTISVNDVGRGTRQRKLLGILSAAAIVALLVATMWPFNFFSPNKVQWLVGGGIEIGDAGTVVSDGPLPIATNGPGGNCAIEFLIQPAGLDSVSTLLSIYAFDNPRQFRVRQYLDGILITHDTVDARGRIRTFKIDVDHIFTNGKATAVAITSGNSGTVVYRDGAMVQAFPKFRISQSDLTGQLILGTSAVDFDPWEGQVRGVAFYARELTLTDVRDRLKDWPGKGSSEDDLVAGYSFREGSGPTVHRDTGNGPDLQIPRFFRIPHKPFLKTPREEFRPNSDYVADVVQNIVGFMPLGFVICAYLCCTRSYSQSLPLATVAGGLLSFSIEVLQFYVPQRASGMTDIITNSTGTLLGALLATPRLVQLFIRAIEMLLPHRTVHSPQD